LGPKILIYEKSSGALSIKNFQILCTEIFYSQNL
jgi:hypothetical protein